MEEMHIILDSIEDIITIKNQIDDVNCGRKCDFELDELEEDLDFKIQNLEDTIQELDENKFGLDFIEKLQDLNDGYNTKEMLKLVKEKISELEERE